MSEQSAPLRTGLPWEELGHHSPARAFRRSLWELIRHPGRFFEQMAVSGGLHEPLTFFGLVLAGLVMAGFPAALSFFGVAAPSVEEASMEAYRAYALPARLTGLLLVLLPLTVVAGCVLMVLTGGIFHAAARGFGAARWEGSVSIWLYSAAAALVPLTAAEVLVFVASLGGYLAGLAWPAAGPPAASVARWSLTVAAPVAVLLSLVVLVSDSVIGCSRAFELDPSLGAAAGVAGLLGVGAVAAAIALASRRWGVPGAAGVSVACASLAAGLALAGRTPPAENSKQRDEEEANQEPS